MSNLPYDAEIEYLQSTGTQYIDTGFKHNQNTRFLCDFEITAATAWRHPFGSYGGTYGSNKLFLVEINDSLGFQTYYGSKSAKGFNGVSLFRRHHFDLNKNVHKIDNQTQTFSASTFQSDYNALIFGAIEYGGSPTGFVQGKCYYFQIYDNDVLVRDYIPVRVGQVGYMYDKVSGQLFGNSGTGDFILGKDKVLPNPFGFRRRLMMAQSGGGLPACFSYCWGLDTSSNYNSTEFLDTGFLPNQDTRVIMKAMSFQQNDSSMCFFGTETPRFSCLFSNSSLRADYNSTMKGSLYNYPLSLLNIDFNKNVFSVNGSLRHIFTYAQFEATRSLYIGNDNGYPSVALNGFMFESQIYDDATLVRDYKPVKDTNGIGYLYDEITGTIYSFDKSSVRGVSLPYTLSGLTFNGSTRMILPICLFVENYDWEIQIVFTANSGQSAFATLLDCTEKASPYHGFTIRIDSNDTSKVNIVWNDSIIFSLSVGTEHSVSVRKQGTSVIITADGSSQTLSYTYKQILDCVTLGHYHSSYGYNFSRGFNGTITSFSYNEL